MINLNYVSIILRLSIYNVFFRNCWVSVLPGFAKEKRSYACLLKHCNVRSNFYYTAWKYLPYWSYSITCIIHRTIINDSSDFWIIWFLKPDSNVRWGVTQWVSRIVEASKVARSCNGEIITLLLRKTNEHTPVKEVVHDHFDHPSTQKMVVYITS